MSFKNILENRDFVAKSLVDMIASEKERIITSGLAPKKDANCAIGHATSGVLKLAEKSRDWRSALYALSYIHNALSAIKIPGDFEKLGSDPLLVDLGNLPIFTEQEYEEKFEDLSGLIDKLKGMTQPEEPVPPKPEISEDEHYDEEAYIDTLRKERESHEGPHEDFVDDTTKNASVIDAVSSHLEKIAYNLGRDGHHEAAYLVERTMRDIKQDK